MIPRGNGYSGVVDMTVVEYAEIFELFFDFKIRYHHFKIVIPSLTLVLMTDIGEEMYW